MDFENPNLQNKEQQERDRQIAEQLRQKLKEIKDFKPSGDIINDFNRFIKLTERDTIYAEVSSEEHPHVVLAGLNAIRAAWESIMKDYQSVDSNNEAKRLFWIDVPKAEIETANRLINFYLNKFSKEDLVRSRENEFNDYEKHYSENDSDNLKDRYASKADENGFVKITDFAIQEFRRQAKSIAEFLNLDSEYFLGEGLRYECDPGNYEASIYIDDLDEFVRRVREHYGS